MRPAIRFMLPPVLCVSLLVLLAMPAVAFDTVTFMGTATVCADSVTDSNNNQKPTAPECPMKPGENNGLYILGQPNGKNNPITGHRIPDPGSPKYHDKYRFRHGNYRFVSTVCTKFNPLADPGPVPCDIEVAGKIGPGPGGMGAACGFSAGDSGRGSIIAANGSEAHVWDVGWPATAGNVLPIKGDYHYKVSKEKGNAQKPNSGQFFGVIVAGGNPACIKSNLNGKQGASTFGIVGVVVTTPVAKKSPKPPKG